MMVSEEDLAFNSYDQEKETSRRQKKTRSAYIDGSTVYNKSIPLTEKSNNPSIPNDKVNLLYLESPRQHQNTTKLSHQHSPKKAISRIKILENGRSLKKVQTVLRSPKRQKLVPEPNELGQKIKNIFGGTLQNPKFAAPIL